MKQTGDGKITVSVELDGMVRRLAFNVRQMRGNLSANALSPDGMKELFQHMLEQKFGKQVTYDATGVHQPNPPLGGDNPGRHGHSNGPDANAALGVVESGNSGDSKRNRRSDRNKDDPKGKKDDGINHAVNTDTYI